MTNGSDSVVPDELDFDDPICGECLEQPFLKTDLEASTEKSRECAICGQERPCLTFENLLERCERVFRDQYQFETQNPDGWRYSLQREGLWERPGETVEHVLQDVGFSYELSTMIHSGLSNLYDDAQGGDEFLFDEEAQYTEVAISTNGLHTEWREIETQLVSGSRYFNKRAESFFADLLENYAEVLERADVAMALRAGPSSSVQSLWRARVFYTDREIEAAMIDPNKELGPPPKEKAGAGRMNAEHVSVFYGATDKDAVLAEVRPPVGARVMLAQFAILESISLFDLSLLDELDLKHDPFDIQAFQRVRKAKFLRELGEMLSRPVLPGRERSDYIITQAFCEFVAQQDEGAFQGLAFDSSQTDGGGRNVVLFNRPNLVARLPAVRDQSTIAQCFEQNEDGEEINYYARVSCIKPSGYVWEGAPKPLLDVDGDSLEVHHIQGIKIKSDARTVRRKVEITPATDEDRKNEFDNISF